MELDDGSGGLAGWAFVEGAGGGVEVVSGGGSGCDVVDVAFGFDLAADANSAGNGVLLAAMPQAYSILLPILSFSRTSNLAPAGRLKLLSA